MSGRSEDRGSLLARLEAELTRVIADAIRYRQAVADRLGLSLSDVTCLTVVSGPGPVTAGDIATHTGLTTGAGTRVIDRLARGGWVRRVAGRVGRGAAQVRRGPHR